MTWIVTIDECGDVGRNGTRYFVIAATIARRSSNLKRVSKLIINDRGEKKYSNTNAEEQYAIMQALSTSNVTILYVVADKYDFMSKYYEQYGKALYKNVFADLIANMSMKHQIRDVNIMVDRTSNITDFEINSILTKHPNLNVMKCAKYNSSSNKCIQIADFVVGAIWHMYERNERTNFHCIQKKIHRP